jgi:hypothetical protein
VEFAATTQLLPLSTIRNAQERLQASAPSLAAAANHHALDQALVDFGDDVAVGAINLVG